MLFQSVFMLDREPGCSHLRAGFLLVSNPGLLLRQGYGAQVGRSTRAQRRWGLFPGWTSSGPVRHRGSIPLYYMSGIFICLFV